LRLPITGRIDKDISSVSTTAQAGGDRARSATGSWIHAFLHREEGDLSNAAYWYRRAGMTMPKDVATANEWAEIAREIWQRENGIIAGREILTSASGLVACSAETPAQEEGVWDAVIRKNGKVTQTKQAAPGTHPVADSGLIPWRGFSNPRAWPKHAT
jgi:hypothetical protein